MSDRNWASPLIGIAVGAAVSLVVYRYGVLSWWTRGFATKLLIGLAIGLGFLAFQLRRNVEQEVSWPLRGAGLVVGAAAAFAVCWIALPTLGRTPLERRSLPGFSIAMPRGTVTVEDVADYAQGLLRIEVDGSAVVGVAWSGQRIASDEDIAMLADMLAGAFEVPPGAFTPTSEFSAGELAVRSFARDLGDTGMAASMVDCGSRQLTVMTFAPARFDYRGLHRRMVASVQCTPDPAQEGGVGRPPPVVIEVPPGWQPGEAETAQIAWFSDTAAVIFQWVNWNDDGPMRNGVEAIVAQFGGTEISGEETVDGRTYYTGQGVFEGEPIGLVVAVFPCGPRHALGLYMGEPGDPQARPVLTSARCP